MAGHTEIRSLTGLRGVAALYVMIYHYLTGSNRVAQNFLDHGYLAVDLFFVLSGFVMGLIYADEFSERASRARYLNFLGRRIARVYPLYIVAITAGLFVICLNLGDYRANALAVDFLLNVVMMQSWFFRESLDGPAWSISAEWAAYLLFPWLAALAFSKKRWLFLVTLLVAVTLVIYSLPAQRLVNQGIPITRCIGAFVLGLLAYRLTLEPKLSFLQNISWLEPTVASLYLLALNVPHSDVACVLLSPVLIFVLSSDRWLVSRMLRTRPVHRLGVLSFSIYLIHDLLGSLMGSIHRAVNQRGFPHGQLVASSVAIPLTLLLSEFACRYIELPGAASRSAIDQLSPLGKSG